MKPREEIKRQAMFNFQGNYWPSVGILVLGWVLSWVLSAIPVAGWFLSLLVGSVITVGMATVSMGIYQGARIEVGQLFAPFDNYGRVLGGMLWMYLWLALWSLIFVVPYSIIMVVGGGWWNVHHFGGIIAGIFLVLSFGLLAFMIVKACSYFCTPYILGLFRNVRAMDALKLSEKIMDGHKADIFMGVLSFIGWFILCGLTFGILWVFYVGPYYHSTMAGFFDEFKADALKRGVITAADLNGEVSYPAR